MIASKEHRILWLPNEERMWDDEGGSRSSAGVRIDSNNAHTVAAVFSCLRVIAETVASLPLHVLERTPGGGKRIARELPLYRQLHAQPNGWQTSFEWREQACFHIGLWGDAFSELRAGQIVPLHPSRMKVERIENGRIRYKFREDKGTETLYSNEQILQIRGPSDDGINGMSIVEECKDAIALARACELHGARFFAAGARPGFVLSTDGSLNAEARESLRSQWDRRHGGVSNAHTTAVLTGGLKPYEIPQSSNSDAQFLELRRYQLEEIARLFRCPGWLLGVGSSSPQSEMEFVTHTILPWLRRFESAFMRDLIEDDDRYLIEFDVRGLMRGDPSSRASFMRSLWEIGALNTDEIRELENMDPVEGGDVRYRPLNMGTLGAPPSEADVLAQQQPGSGIDGQAVEGGLAAAAGEAVPAVPGEPVEPEAPQVADVSLNGAQITGAIAIVSQVTAGVLTKDGAAALLSASFPSMSTSQIAAILAGVVEGQPVPAADPAQPPQAEPVPTAPAGRSLIQSRECGANQTGGGGFQPGNTCGKGGQGGGEGGGPSGGDSGGSSGESPSGGSGQATAEVKAWAEKKFSDPEHAKAFTEWFGDSKVVDENGEPLLIHKGMPRKDWKTGSDIDAVESTNGPWAGFFSDDKAVADKFAKSFMFTGDTQVVTGYASIRQPYVIDAGGKPASSVQFDAVVDGPRGPRVAVSPRIKEVIDSGRYDGIIIRNTSDEGNVFVPLRPESVKSSGNVGTFDPKSKNFNRSLKESRDCGANATGGGGFQPGNSCGKGGGGGGGDGTGAGSRYRAAKTKEEAEKIATAYAKKVSFRGLDVDSANQVNKALDEFFQMHPDVPPLESLEAKKFTGSAATGKEDAAASYQMLSHKMQINTAIMGSEKKWDEYARRGKEAEQIVAKALAEGRLEGRKKEIAEMHLSRGSLVDDSFAGAITHEMGHHFDAKVLMKEDISVRKRLMERRSEFEPKLSGYASTNAFEYFAESYVAYRRGREGDIDPELKALFDKRSARK